jgi:short subunit dehydrogenase-like uncharacterized protein
MSSRVLVLGATGYTGRLICRKLKANNIDFIVAGRDEKKIYGFYPHHQYAIIDVMDKSQLDKHLNNCDILINAVGPFNLSGYKVVRSAAEHGLQYLDITGEQHFVKFCLDKMNRLAEENKALIVNSCSFESLVADLMANEICLKETDYEDISTFYHFINPSSSMGTKLSMKLAKYFNTYMLRDGKLEVAAPMSQQQEIDIEGLNGLNYASFIPFPEVLFFHKEYKLTSAASYYVFENRQSAPVSFDRKRSKIDFNKTIDRFKRGKRIDPTENERKDQQFSLAVISKTRKGEKNQIILTGNDMYNITAEIMAQCVKMLIDEKVEDFGVKTPAEFFADRDLLGVLLQAGNIKRIS